MGEIKTNDLQEVKRTITEGFTEIKPQKGTTVNEARDFCDSLFTTPDVIERDGILDKREMDNNDSAEGAPRFIITRNMGLENDRHPITGVPFEQKTIELPSKEKIEGIFPVFDSLFSAELSEDLFLESDKTQFCECNKQLLEAIENDPGLKEKFSEEQIDQIRDGVSDGTAPDGFVWHHDAEVGIMQLVDFDTHTKTGHTGGRSLWGGGSEYRS